jgi:hypothetical protein
MVTFRDLKALFGNKSRKDIVGMAVSVVRDYYGVLAFVAYCSTNFNSGWPAGRELVHHPLEYAKTDTHCESRDSAL